LNLLSGKRISLWQVTYCTFTIFNLFPNNSLLILVPSAAVHPDPAAARNTLIEEVCVNPSSMSVLAWYGRHAEPEFLSV
jgi:hypothetical protein